MKNEELGNQFMALIAQAMGGNAETLEGTIKAIVKQTIAETGGATVTHEIKSGAKVKKIDGILPQEFDRVLCWTSKRTPSEHYNAVMMTGNAGTGKGTIARKIAEALDAEFYEVNAIQDKFELTGFVNAEGEYIPSQFFNACLSASEGNEVVFLFDEMDCSIPEVLKIFNEALSSYEFTFPSNETLDFKEHMHFICACNTYGTGADMKYVGNQLDKSTLDRFALVKVKYDPKVDLACALGDTDLCEFFAELRKATANMQFEASYRSIQRIVSVKGEMPMNEILEDALFKELGEDDLNMIRNCLNRAIANNPYTKVMNGEQVKFTPAETEETTETKKKKTAKSGRKTA